MTASLDEGGGYIVDVPYTRHFARELTPAWLDLVATISGVQPPLRDGGFSWCDLGCGHGLTAAILAASHPNGLFCGIDFNEGHIQSARRFAAEAGITNAAFHCADFASASEVVSGRFDYIVCNGVYSWVDQRSQQALLQFVDRHLKPGGLFYVSYYAMPGRAADLPLQRLVRAFGLALPGDSMERSSGAIDMVRKFGELNVPALRNSPMARTLAKPLSKQDLGYLPHEYMTADWNPLCVTDVRDALRGIGLEPAGTAILMENFDSFVLGEAARATLATIADDGVRELARDYVINQSFRRDVFVRDGRAFDGDGQRVRLLDTSFALTRPVDQVHYACKTPAGTMRYDNAMARAIVGALARGPRTLNSIGSDYSLPAEGVVTNALTLAAAGAIRPVESRQTSVSALNRAVCRRLGGPEEVHFVAMPCGTALLLDDELLQFVAGRGGSADGNGWQEFLSAYGMLP